LSKVIFISDSLEWSGSTAQLFVLAKGLEELGWEVCIASPEGGELACRIRPSGLGHSPLDSRQDRFLDAAQELADLLAEENADILHAHQPRAHSVGLAALYLMESQPAFVVTRRLAVNPDKNAPSRLKFRNPMVDGFIVVTDSLRRALAGAGVPPDRIATIPGGVDTDLFQPREKDRKLLKELGVPEGVPVIGHITHFSEWKGQPLVLEAAAKLAASGRKAVYLFAGRDTDSEEMRSRVRKAGLGEEAVRLLGFRSDVPRLLSVCDISVSASNRGDASSGPVREALAMRIPVAVSDTAGNADLIRDGRNGRLFSVGSSDDLARVLGEMLDDPVAARHQAAAGCRLVRELFSNKELVSATAAFYKKLLERKSAAGWKRVQPH